MNIGSAMRSIRIHAENEAFRKSASNVVEKLYTQPWKPVRVTSKLAKHILILHETLMANGTMYSTQVRNVGAGVKEVYLKEMTT